MKKAIGGLFVFAIILLGANYFVKKLPITHQNNLAQVGSGGAPMAQFSATCPALQCTFDASGSTGTSIISYSWNWGTGQAVEVKTATTAKNTFTAGTYTVTLTVTDSIGRTGSSSQSVTVGGQATPTPSPVPTPTPSPTPTPNPTPTPTPSPTPTPASVVSSPELPRVYIDTTMPNQTGSTVYVANNCTGFSTPCSTGLQNAINNAQPGDTIVLKAGDTFLGTFTLPNKGNNSQWILIRSSKLSSLPPLGTRVSLSDAVNMPTITGGNSTPQIAIQTVPQANHYRFSGIRFTPNPAIIPTGFIRIGDGTETTVAQLPHDITFDRNIMSGDPVNGGRRALALNGRMLAVVDSYINDWKDAGNSDSQAIIAWNGAEGYKIVNNFLEGATENIMFGGAANNIPNVNPSDIEIRHNFFYKNPVLQSQPQFTEKNLFETKTGERILLEGNVMDGSWAGAQDGKAINIKSTNSGNSGSYPRSGEITIRYNLIRNVGMVASMAGVYGSPATTMSNIEFSNNVVEKINISPYVGRADMFLMSPGNGPMTNVAINHNTIVTTGYANSVIQPAASSVDGFSFNDNIIMNGVYGIKAPGITSGNPSIAVAFTNAVFNKNAWIGGSTSVGTNSFAPANLNAVNFTNLSAGNYLIASGALKNGASDGKDVGADIAMVNQMTAGVINGTPGFTPTPSPTPTPNPTPSPVPSPSPTPTPPAFKAGDINQDGIVNSIDWSLMNAKWFTSNASADLNKDGIVNSIDFSILNFNWLKP